MAFRAAKAIFDLGAGGAIEAAPFQNFEA